MTRKSHAISSKAGFRRYASSLTIFPNLKAYNDSGAEIRPNFYYTSINNNRGRVAARISPSISRKSARSKSTCVPASVVERQHLQISRRKAPPICGAHVVVGVLICLCRLRLQKGRDAFYTR
ncbi:unnamed protein product [Trichogramma brassicae]|uniref:Uncharacterized protein n=1 Tax=Trichogramma brassicae TaxID=86971 RepID=A0A6H5IST4_9HYME|nr:unnamed protein product [Trichogramma brassicae]